MTTSYPRHVASDKLYGQLDEQIDKFVEVYIGKYGRPKLGAVDLKFALTVYTDQSMVEFLDKFVNYLTKDVFAHIKDTDADLITIRDDMLASVNQTKYLFTLR